MRLSSVTGDLAWLGPVPRVLTFLKRTQNRMTGHAGLQGGIKGSWPLSGHYAPFEVLNWATKFFVDALMEVGNLGDGDVVTVAGHRAKNNPLVGKWGAKSVGCVIASPLSIITPLKALLATIGASVSIRYFTQGRTPSTT